MQVECAGYEIWRAGDAIKSKRQAKLKRDADNDAAKWERFLGIVQSGSDIKVWYLRSLETRVPSTATFCSRPPMLFTTGVRLPPSCA